MLNAMRFGHLEPETVTKFQGLSRPIKYPDGIEPTDLQVSQYFCSSIIPHACCTGSQLVEKLILAMADVWLL